MFRRLTLILAAAAFPLAASADDNSQSANVMVPGCRGLLNEQGDAESGVCAGVMFSLLSLGDTLLPPLQFCPPQFATVDQANRITLKFLDAHPERTHESFLLLTIVALKTAWPCPS